MLANQKVSSCFFFVHMIIGHLSIFQYSCPIELTSGYYIDLQVNANTTALVTRHKLEV